MLNNSLKNVLINFNLFVMNVIKSYNKLSADLKEGLSAFYPDGFERFTKTISIKGDQYLVVPFQFGDSNYLVKLKKLQVDKGDVDFSKIKWEGQDEEVF